MSTAKAKLASGFVLPTPPARQPVPDDAAARFVGGPANDDREQGRGETTSRLRRAQGGERLAIYLPPELARELRVRCAVDRRSASDAVTEALRTWLQGSSPEGT
jgi:hypothetical protein